MSFRFWLFQALATSTSPMAPSRSSVDRLADRRAAPALHADLHHPARLAGRLDHQPPLADVVRAGLLDVDVLAGLAGQDRGRPVPVVGGRDPDGVDGLVVEDPAEVLDDPGRLAGRLRPVGRLPGPRLVNVAGVGEVDVVPRDEGPDVARPHLAAADHGDRQAAVRPDGPGRGPSWPIATAPAIPNPAPARNSRRRRLRMVCVRSC